MREKPLGISQSGALRLHGTKLLQEGEGDDLPIRESLERLVTVAVRVEQGVGVVDEPQHDTQSLFRLGEPLGVVGLGHLLLLRERRLRWPFSTPNPRNTEI